MTQEEAKQVLDLVKKELCSKLNKTKLDDYDEIPMEAAEELLANEGLFIYSEYKDKLKSPWAVARYMALCTEEKELIERVKADLKDIIPDTVEEFFIKRLTCNIQFNKKFIEGAKKQSLTVNYFLDEDDVLHYKLVSTSLVGWDISKTQLHALLQNKGFFPEVFKEVSWFKRFITKLMFWRH